METIYLITGLLGIYTTIHFFVLQFKRSWKERSLYEKIVTLFAIIFISLIYLSIMLSSQRNI